MQFSREPWMRRITSHNSQMQKLRLGELKWIPQRRTARESIRTQDHLTLKSRFLSNLSNLISALLSWKSTKGKNLRKKKKPPGSFYMDYYFTICFLPNPLIGPAPPWGHTPQRGTVRGKRGSRTRRVLGQSNAAVILPAAVGTRKQRPCLLLTMYQHDAGCFAKIDSATGVFALYPRFRSPAVDRSSGLSAPGSPDDPPSALVSQGQQWPWARSQCLGHSPHLIT